jgi:hypothetical protein
MQQRWTGLRGPQRAAFCSICSVSHSLTHNGTSPVTWHCRPDFELGRLTHWICVESTLRHIPPMGDTLCQIGGTMRLPKSQEPKHCSANDRLGASSTIARMIVLI